MSGHQFAQMATTIATDKNKRRVAELIEHVRKHEWRKLSSFKEFEVTRNAAIVYAILGPHAAGMAVLIRDPYELYETAEVYVQERLTPDEVALVRELIPLDAWGDL